MLNEHTIYLINAGIDGELSPAEMQELEALLESSAEARAMKAEFLRLSNLLDSQPDQQPPEGLAKLIVDQVKLPAAKPSSLVATWLSYIQHPAATGLAFAAGLLMAVAFYQVAPQHVVNTDTANMVGTMIASPQGTPATAGDSLLLEAAGLSGSISLRNESDFYVLNFDLNSQEPFEIEVAFAEAGLDFSGLARTVGGGESTDSRSFDISGGTLRVVNQGSHQFVLFLQRSDGPGSGLQEIGIGVNRLGESVLEGSLRFDGESS
jgi:hypothetical protein